MLAELAALSLREERVDEAERIRAGLARDRGRGSATGPDCVFGVGLLSCVAAERGELDRAGRLWGAIENERAFAPLGGWQRHRDACEARIRPNADGAFDEGLAAGRGLELEDAVDEALGR